MKRYSAIPQLQPQQLQQQTLRSKSTLAKRQSGNKDVLLNRTDLQLIDEGDVFYRVHRLYPTYPEIEDDVSLLIVRAVDLTSPIYQSHSSVPNGEGRRSASGAVIRTNVSPTSDR